MNNTYSKNQDISGNYTDRNTGASIVLIVFIAIPLAVGVVSALLTRDAMVMFNSMNKPPFAPPAWLFPVAWTILYILMGISCFLIFASSDEDRYTGLMLYAFQLVVNFTWSLIFFRLDAYVFAAVWLAILIIMIVALIINTSRYSKAAMIMLFPYLAWCCFAMYLNVGIAILN